MKRFLCFLFLTFFATLAMSQSDSSGVYLSVMDFSKHKLSYGCNCRTENCPLSAIPLFPSQKITIKHGGQKHILKKSELFGYKGCNNKIFRFFGKSQYLILNSQDLFLYEKTEESGTGMNPEIEDFYYFSVSAETKILPLTSDNLKEAFPRNVKFHDLLDSFFKSDSELIAYDKYLQNYKLLHVLEESKK